MRFYGKFWLITAGLFALALICWWYVADMAELSNMLRNRQTLYAGGIMVLLFVFSYISIHNVVLRLFRDDQAMTKLEMVLSSHDSMEPSVFRAHVLAVCNDPKTLGEKSRVSEALRLLAIRKHTSETYHAETQINRSVFQHDFEEVVGSDGNHLGNIMVLFFMAGFFALIMSIYVTFLTSQYPKTLEETALYSSHMLSGLGLSYLLTAIGIGSGLLTHLIKMLIYDPYSAEILARFRAVNFTVIFPIIQGSRTEVVADAVKDCDVDDKIERGS